MTRHALPPMDRFNLELSVNRSKCAQHLLMRTIFQETSITQWVKSVTNQIVRITALQLLAIAGYKVNCRQAREGALGHYASLCLVLRTPVRTLWPV